MILMVNNISQKGPTEISVSKDLPNNHKHLMEHQRDTGNETYSKRELYDFIK